MATTGPYRVIIGYNPIDKDSEGCLLGHYSGHQNAKAAAYRKSVKVPVYWWRVEEQTEPDKEWKVRERWQAEPGKTEFEVRERRQKAEEAKRLQQEIDAAEAKSLGKELSGLNCFKCGRPLYYVKPGEVERACSRCGHTDVRDSGLRCAKCNQRINSVNGILERPCPSCGDSRYPVNVMDLSDLFEECAKNIPSAKEEAQVGQWVLAGGKPDGKNCKHCLALHTKKMTYGKFLDKQYTTSCGGECRCSFKPGTTVEPQTAEQLKAIRGQVGQWVLAGMEPDGDNCEDCLALHGKKMTYGKFLDMKHEMTDGGDECRCDFKPGATVKPLTQEEIRAALEE
jgi:hypothetical protein